MEAADRRHSLRAERDEIDRMHRLVGLELRQHRIELEKLELTSQPTESVQETILRMEQQVCKRKTFMLLCRVCGV